MADPALKTAGAYGAKEFGSGLERSFVPRRGYTTQPGVSTPGTDLNRTAPCRGAILIGLITLRKERTTYPFQNAHRLAIHLGFGERLWEVWTLFSGAPSGRMGGGVRFLGLKPQAESCSPFGAKTRSIANSCQWMASIFVTLSFWRTRRAV